MNPVIDDSGLNVGQTSKKIKVTSNKYNLFADRIYEHGATHRHDIETWPQSIVGKYKM